MRLPAKWMTLVTPGLQEGLHSTLVGDIALDEGNVFGDGLPPAGG